ncbi:ABC transporter permease [Microtetraspora sp. AC03309]|uniref:ABC transporter permease n=1 Tax=Microtetraspora sp. AC03309 TaxID=2779376 RepID=UPI001E59FF2B|nr:ABC transporter permease [Microtetraspora sp. AC03309]MCC5576384.1 ABC transporter permease [Microtetraspora sp. AC03309]
MINFLIRRIAGAVVILLVIVAVTFGLFYAVPRDPARLFCGKICTPEMLEFARQSLGLDEPILTQFRDYLVGLVAGRDIGDVHCAAPCLGYSFTNKRLVLAVLADRFPATLSLALGAAVLFLVAGVGGGMLAARFRGTWVDKTTTGVALVGSSLQIYFVGIVAMYILVDQWQLLARPSYVSPLDDAGQWFSGMLLPWAVLAFIFTSTYTRFTRSTMIETLGEDFVRTARAKGMPGRTVFFKYAARGSAAPLATIFGLDMASLLGGAVITETTFNIPGIGQLAVNSVTSADLPILMGVTLVAATAMLVANIAVDACYAAIDPRVRTR